VTLKAYSLIFGYLCINAAIWTLKLANILPDFGIEAPMDPSNILTMFSLNTFTAITGVVGGAVIGILTLMTRSYALGTGVLMLWIVGVIFKPIQDIFVGLPFLLQAFLPPSVWFLSQPIVAFGGLVLFFFIVEVIAGREIIT
jgi:hypothetical protein